MEASGELLFDRNTAVFGGGIAMDDRCLVSGGEMVQVGRVEGQAQREGV